MEGIFSVIILFINDLNHLFNFYLFYFTSIVTLQKNKNQLWIILDKGDYNFKGEIEIDNSVEKIAIRMIEKNKKWKKLIDNWKNL